MDAHQLLAIQDDRGDGMGIASQSTAAQERTSIAWLPDVPGGAGGGPPWQFFFGRCGEVKERGPARLPRRVDAQGENVR